MDLSQLAEFVSDEGVVKAAASLFPTEVIMNSMGTSPARFMLLQHPITQQWWAGAWGQGAMGEPEQLLLAAVAKVHVLTSARIDLEVVLAEGSATTTSLLIRSSQGGCCGNRLRTWSPFGFGIAMVHAPYTDVTPDPELQHVPASLPE